MKIQAERVPVLPIYLVVLVVRDPRDVLISGYFSMAYSHGNPPKTSNKYKNFMEKRNFSRKTTIDE